MDLIVTEKKIYLGNDVQSIFLGDGPIEIAYDICVVAALDEALTQDAKNAIMDFIDDGGSVIWIYDVGTYGLNGANYLQIDDFYTLNVNSDSREAFNVPNGVSHEILNGISDAGSVISFTQEWAVGGPLGSEKVVMDFTIHGDRLYAIQWQVAVAGYRLYNAWTTGDGNWTQYGMDSTTGIADDTNVRIYTISSLGSYLYIGVHDISAPFAPLKIYRSTNGQSWSLIATLPTDTRESKRMITWSNKLWLSCRYYNAPTEEARLYSSSDGSTWTQQFSLSGTDYIHDIYYWEGSNHLYISVPYGGDLRIYRSASGGSGTWSLVKTITGEESGFFSAYHNKLYIGTSSSAQIWETTTGSTWSNVYTFSGHVNVNSMEVFNNYLYAVVTDDTNSSYYIFRSNDPATTWNEDTTIFEKDWFISYSNVLQRFNGRLYLGTYDDGDIYAADEPIAPIHGNIIKSPQSWYGDGSWVYVPSAGIVLLWSWREDSNWIAFVTAYENTDVGRSGTGRFVSIADSNMFTNSAPDYNEGSNGTLLNNIFTYAGYNGNRTRILWLTGDWSGDKDGWLDLNETTTWGASNLKSYLEGQGFTITQKKVNVSDYIDNGNLQGGSQAIRGTPGIVLLGDE